MSEMIERVAKAIFDAWCSIKGLPDASWDEAVRAQRKGMPVSSDIVAQARIEARAAIAAMREPTEAMAGALGDQWGSGALADWQTMIDEALRCP